jgi:hypothetical protein
MIAIASKLSYRLEPWNLKCILLWMIIIFFLLFVYLGWVYQHSNGYWFPCQSLVINLNVHQMLKVYTFIFVVPFFLFLNSTGFELRASCLVWQTLYHLNHVSSLHSLLKDWHSLHGNSRILRILAPMQFFFPKYSSPSSTSVLLTHTHTHTHTHTLTVV